MATTASPAKEQVRHWLMQRRLNPCPLPDREQIRRQLGWGGAEAEREAPDHAAAAAATAVAT